MSTAGAAATKEQILDVAERAIAQNGYAGTTLRSIVKEAGVNLAAVHYHFGSKEGLYEALIARIAKPIVSEQLAGLDGLEAAADGPLTAQMLLTAYLKPSLAPVMQGEKVKPMRSQFIGRCRTEPDPLKTIAAEQFKPGTERYLDAFQRALPNQTRSQLTWKLDLVVTCLIRVLAEAGKPGALMVSSQPEDVKSAIEQLTMFLLPGLESD
ncbi:MAG: TetR/AcrR family transcriptional regulator [Phormidesmis sp.]